jgi:Domain of unknown function (DUF4157)
MAERSRMRQKVADGAHDSPRNKVQQVVESGGEPLPAQVLSHMEGHFGHDFSNVRVHSDGRAADSAKALHANAYATGPHLVFNAGKYDPDSSRGRELIGHELTHVVQQGEMKREASGGTPRIVRDDHLELAAEAEGRQAESQPAGHMDLMPTNLGATVSASIQCDEEQEDKDWKNIKEGTVAAGEFAADLLGLGCITSPLGVAHSVTEGAEDASKGDTGGSIFNLAKGTTQETSLIAEMGGFEMLGEGGISGAISAISENGIGVLGEVGGLGEGAAATMDAGAALTGAGLEGAAALGPAAAVIGSGFAGWEMGKALDSGVNKIGQAITGDDKGDYSISGGLASLMTSADQTISGLFADPSKPAYTQTLGWKLANLFD